MFVCLFVLLLYVSQVNSYGHGRTVSSPNHTFSWASLNNQYFVHILLLVTDNKVSKGAKNDSAGGRRMTAKIIS